MFDTFHKFIKSLKQNKRASGNAGLFGKLLGLFLGIMMGVALVPDSIRTLANVTTWADTPTVVQSLGTLALPIIVMGIFIILLIKETGVDL